MTIASQILAAAGHEPAGIARLWPSGSHQVEGP
jgi:hypothetical protein